MRKKETVSDRELKKIELLLILFKTLVLYSFAHHHLFSHAPLLKFLSFTFFFPLFQFVGDTICGRCDRQRYL